MEDAVMRQPYQVLVFPFRIGAEGPRYAVFRRSDDANWQSVCGGVEDGEDLITAARRETREEAGIAEPRPVYRLDMVSGVAKSCFAAGRHWPANLYIVPKHYFAMDAGAGADGIRISAEHSEFRWASYAAAREALRYDDDKNALWELDTRLRNNDLPEAAP
jgi:dATP pyrophosphohydrolase